MRLAPFLLTSILVAPLFGEGPVMPPAWRTGALPALESHLTLLPSQGPLTLRLSPDGVVRVFSVKGVRKMRAGLPGRPIRAWRDGGIPVVDPLQPMTFPQDTPLSGQAKVGQELDARPDLAGLLWILDDGERHLTVIHPATAQMLKLPLPDLDGLMVGFEPAGIQLKSPMETWHLPWAQVLPWLAPLRTPKPGPPPGTAFEPYPNR